MNGREYQRMFEIEATYWWFVARRQLIEHCVGQRIGRLSLMTADKTAFRILDAGCGTGANLKMLAGYGDVAGVDVSTEALKFSSQSAAGALLRGKIESLGFHAESFDLITALDVLEHVEDDRAAIAELSRIMRPGGRSSSPSQPISSCGASMMRRSTIIGDIRAVNCAGNSAKPDFKLTNSAIL